MRVFSRTLVGFRCTTYMVRARSHTLKDKACFMLINVGVLPVLCNV